MDYKQLHETAITELGQYRELAASGNVKDNQKAAVISATLLSLSERDRYILEQLFTYSTKRKKEEYVANVMVKYGLSKTELYRLREGALTNYCISMIIAVMGGKLCASDSILISK